ncbi:MAG: sulfotransferase family protein [Hormoscilla sp. GUM202]|nr:sulfotransferase family protein [Hormoscilla sp. GM7CHS1pb]MBO1351402.1 sulfotransferase family protein [Hormoscilla sp. GUM202]
MQKNVERLGGTKPKIVVLWGVPRSISTAFEKTFSQRDDTEIVHEPFADVYFFSKWRRSDLFGDCPEHYEYSASMAMEAIMSKVAPLVFCKDMAFQALPYISKDFIGSAINTFIIRHPLETIASIYKQNVSVTEEEFGFTALDRIFSIVTNELGKQPIVVEANRFRRDSQQVLSQYCQSIGVDFEPQMLQWETGSLKQWKPHEIEFQAQWHQTLENSTTILAPTEVKVELHTEDVEMVERAIKIYDRLSAFAL